MPLISDHATDLGSAPTASDVILKFIRDSIINGTLDEGEPIRQDDVARMFNVSKIPVREALKRLEAEGLVAFQKNRGAIVTSSTEPEIAQIFELRAILESNAIRLSIPHMTDRTFQEAQEYCDAFAGEHDIGHWAELNWRFHSRLYVDGQRPYMLNMIRTVNDRIERYLRIQLTLSHGHQVADEEHRQILELCRRRDVNGAGDLLYAHIMRACESLLDHLPKGASTTKPPGRT